MQLQGSLEMTARLTYEFAPSDPWAAANQSLRLSHEGRRVNARTTCGCLAFDARLSQECYEAYDNYKLHGCPAADVRLQFPVKDI